MLNYRFHSSKKKKHVKILQFLNFVTKKIEINKRQRIKFKLNRNSNQSIEGTDTPANSYPVSTTYLEPKLATKRRPAVNPRDRTR